MEANYLHGLDEYFCATYSDYVRLSAIEGYKMPDMLTVGRDGNVVRKQSEQMRLCYQEKKDALLKTLKEGLQDTDFTFHFSFIPFSERLRDLRRKHTFAKVLPSILAHADETPESAGEKLDIRPAYWQRIVKGKLYPEKCTVLALALVCRLSMTDANNLLAVCGFTLQPDNVRDVVVGYLLEQKIFNEDMRDRCLSEYKIVNLPILRKGAEETQAETAE